MNSGRYVILPGTGFRSDVLATGRLQTQAEFEISRPGTNKLATVRVLDQISHDGPKLVEMASDGEIALMREYAGDIRIIPMHLYARPKPDIRDLRFADSSTDSSETSQIWPIAVSGTDHGGPLPGATVIAFTDFRQREGMMALTDQHGIASIALPQGEKVERLYVFQQAATGAASCLAWYAGSRHKSR